LKPYLYHFFQVKRGKRPLQLIVVQEQCWVLRISYTSLTSFWDYLPKKLVGQSLEGVDCTHSCNDPGYSYVLHEHCF
jgi:hypothetical protein